MQLSFADSGCARSYKIVYTRKATPFPRQLPSRLPDFVVTRQQLFVLREDECFQFVGLERCEIRKNAMSGNHCRESSRVSFTAKLKSTEKQNYFVYTAICGA